MNGMQKGVLSVAMLVLGFLGNAGCAIGAQDEAFKTLEPETCFPLQSSKLSVQLSAGWKDYLPSVRVCPLRREPDTDATVYVVSIFVKDYYRDKPALAPWEDFPKPLVVNDKGETVGKLEELYPSEDVGKMILTFGHWRGHLPGEIRMHIRHPGVAGDYDLPTLIWNAEKKRYDKKGEDQKR